MKTSILYSIIISMIGILSIASTYSIHKSMQKEKETDKDIAIELVEYGRQYSRFVSNTYPNKSKHFTDSVFKSETEKFVNKLYK